MGSEVSVSDIGRRDSRGVEKDVGANLPWRGVEKDIRAEVREPLRNKISHKILRYVCPSRRRHTRCSRDWSSDVCSSDLQPLSTFCAVSPVKASQRRITMDA